MTLDEYKQFLLRCALINEEDERKKYAMNWHKSLSETEKAEVSEYTAIVSQEIVSVFQPFIDAIQRAGEHVITALKELGQQLAIISDEMSNDG